MLINSIPNCWSKQWRLPTCVGPNICIKLPNLCIPIEVDDTLHKRLLSCHSSALRTVAMLTNPARRCPRNGCAVRLAIRNRLHRRPYICERMASGDYLTNPSLITTLLQCNSQEGSAATLDYTYTTHAANIDPPFTRDEVQGCHPCSRVARGRCAPSETARYVRMMSLQPPFGCAHHSHKRTLNKP